MTLPPALSTTIPVLSLSISVLALVIAIRSYRRKAGIDVRGVFSFTSSRACNDEYVSQIILENLKDRAVTIFATYLKVGYSYYVELENFEAQPLVLRPFETYQKQFGPIEFYAVSNRRIILNELLRDERVKKRLVLSTPDGRYTVASRMRQWNPVADYFSNHLTGIVRPVALTHKGTYLGGNIAYMIEVRTDDDEQIIPIHPEDYQLKRFREFSLTKESLSSKQALEQFLQKQMDEGRLPCRALRVWDLQEWRQENRDFYTGATIHAKSYTVFQYYVLGRFWSKYQDWKTKRENEKRTRSIPSD